MRNNRIVTIGDAAFTARPHVGMGVTKAAKDAFTLSEHLDHNKYLESLNDWESSRLIEGKFIVNRSRILGKYLFSYDENETLEMPDVINVLKDTAISLNDIIN
jgi:2-polyprenyl-6-methoxyphenol hydroxylase-like FAD-dependent oxidoreductase